MINPIYVNEPCPLEGYDDTSVRVLANSTDKEWRQWASTRLELPGCEACAKLSAPKVPRGRKAKAAPEKAADTPVMYCPSCTAARSAYAQAFVLFYGPELLGHDISTPEAALSLLDRDDVLPSEIVIWLQLVPAAVRTRRQETLLGNLISS